MTIYEALAQLHFNKRCYFQYKHPDIRFDQSQPIKSEAEFLRTVDKKTMNSFYRWEKTPEYKTLVALYLDSKIATDLEQIYMMVREKALIGDDRAVKLFLQLSTEISKTAKQAQAIINKDQEDDDDGLIV